MARRDPDEQAMLDEKNDWVRNQPLPEGTPVREVGEGSREAAARAKLEATIVDVAIVCHEANRAYCFSVGDYTQRPWGAAPDWQRSSAISGVRAHLAGGGLSPRQSHESWLAEKFSQGWIYGPVKDAFKKEHPCCVPYDELPDFQRRKDVLFGAIVKALMEPIA